MPLIWSKKWCGSGTGDQCTTRLIVPPKFYLNFYSLSLSFWCRCRCRCKNIQDMMPYQPVYLTIEMWMVGASYVFQEITAGPISLSSPQYHLPLTTYQCSNTLISPTHPLLINHCPKNMYNTIV